MPEMTVGDLAARGRVNSSTVRFWDDHGLLTSRRTPGNQRRFDDIALAEVRFIRWSQDVGAGLDDIRNVLQLLPDGMAPDNAVRAQAASCWKRGLDEQARLLRARYRLLRSPDAP